MTRRDADNLTHDDASPRLFSLHGHCVRLAVDYPLVFAPADAALSPLLEEQLPFEPIDGRVTNYDAEDVLRSVSTDARRVSHPMLELFRSPGGERLWHVDERWGLSSIDLVRGRWQSFVVPRPRLSPRRLFESTVWWPLSCLLAGRGLHLIPATFADDGTLHLSGGELDASRDGRAWSCLRQESGRLRLLDVPTSERPPRRAWLAGVRLPPRVTTRPMPRQTVAALRSSWPMPITTASQSRLMSLLAAGPTRRAA